MNPSCLLTVSTASLLALTISASAQLVLTNTSTISLDFDTDVANIYMTPSGAAVGGNASVAEPDAYNAFSESNANRSGGLYSTAWALQYAYTDGGAPSLLAADANGDADTIDVLNYNGRTTVQGQTESGLPTRVIQLTEDTDFGTNGLFLRIQNNTGSALTGLTVAADLFVADSDTSFSPLSFGYAVSNTTDPGSVSYINVNNYAGVNTGGVFTYQSVAGGINETISLSVANGDYVILAWQDGGNGSSFAMDNLQITPVPGGGGLVVPVGVDVAVVGADVQCTFDSVNGQSYQLLVSTDDMASFAPVAGASDTGDGNPLTLTDTGGAPASGSKVFYKVETN